MRWSLPAVTAASSVTGLANRGSSRSATRMTKKKVIAKIPLVDTAISTSGDYERYFDEDGVRYHHIIDPRTGHSASKVRSATILASTATRTDGLSKTAFVLGADEAMKIYDKLDDVDAILVTPDGRVLYSKGLEAAKPPPGAQPSTAPVPQH